MHFFSTPLQRVQWFGILVMAVLAIMASWLYLERGTYMDVAFQTFELIRTRTLAPQVYRFGSGLTQVFPLLAIWMKAPLYMVVYMYSIGVILYQTFLFLYIAFLRKNAPLAFSYVLYLCLATTHSFFWIQSEFSQSIPFCFACLAFIQHRSTTAWPAHHYVIWLGLLITGVFFHPLQAPLFLLFFFLLFLQDNNKKIILLSMVTVLLIWGLKQVYFSNWYDNMAGERLKELSHIKQHAWGIHGMQKMLGKTGWYYGPCLLVLLLFIMEAWRHKRWLYLSIIPICCIAYFVFIHATHPTAEPFYLENLLLAIPALIAFGLGQVSGSHATTFFSNKTILVSGFVLAFFVVRIAHVSGYYKQRIAVYHHLVHRYLSKKIMLPANELPHPSLQFAWPTAYEVWIHSTLETGRTASLVFIDDTSKYNPLYSPNKQFRGVRNYPYDSLTAPYFIWTDTTTRYFLK